MREWVSATLLQQANRVLVTYQSQQADAIAQSLQPWAGSTLRILLTDLNLELLFEVQQQVCLLSQHNGQPFDCTLQCRASLLPKLKDPSLLPELIKSGELELEGNIQIASKVAETLSNTRFDQEEWLSQYLGDVPAHFFCAGVRKLLRWLEYRYQQTEADVTEWLMDEARWLPYSAEYRQQSVRITSLIDRVDSLEERIQLLQKRTSLPEPEIL